MASKGPTLGNHLLIWQGFMGAGSLEGGNRALDNEQWHNPVRPVKNHSEINIPRLTDP